MRCVRLCVEEPHRVYTGCTVNGRAWGVGGGGVLMGSKKNCIASVKAPHTHVLLWIQKPTRHRVGTHIMTHLEPHLSLATAHSQWKTRTEKKFLRLVSSTSLASPTAALPFLPDQPPSLPARSYTSLFSLSLSYCVSPCALTHVLGLTGLMCWWCRCEETTSAGRLPATAPLLRDNRSTDLHTLAAISVVKPRPRRRLLRADRDAPKGRGRVVGGFAGLDYCFVHMPSVAPVSLCIDKEGGKKHVLCLA